MRYDFFSSKLAICGKLLWGLGAGRGDMLPDGAVFLATARSAYVEFRNCLL
jgi:hypothetical protein